MLINLEAKKIIKPQYLNALFELKFYNNYQNLLRVEN